MTDEKVVVVYRERLDDLRGFRAYTDFNLTAAEFDLCFEYLMRDEAEVSDRHIQIIPSTVLLLPTGEHIGFQRRKGGRANLSDKITLTVGGHISPEELDGVSVTVDFRKAMLRELREEFVAPFPEILSTTPVGAILDWTGENTIDSSRHACFLFRTVVSEVPQPAADEEFDLSVASVVIDDPRSYPFQRYDPWSAIYTASL